MEGGMTQIHLGGFLSAGARYLTLFVGESDPSHRHTPRSLQRLMRRNDSGVKVSSHPSPV